MRFYFWIFDLLNIRPLDDLFDCSAGPTPLLRFWNEWKAQPLMGFVESSKRGDKGPQTELWKASVSPEGSSPERE